MPTLTIRKSKTRAGERTIPLSPETARMLTRRRASAEFAADTDPIFSSEAGTPMDDHNYRRRVFKPAAERGHGAADIAAMLGHADGGLLALKTYIHPKVRPVDFVDDVLSGNMP